MKLIFMLLLLAPLSLASNDIPGFKDPLPASQSDYGILTLRNATTDNSNDANLYFVDDLEMTNKIHVIVAITDCACVGFGDIEKINQLDYLAIRHYMFSFGIYVSYNIPYRARCGYHHEEVQARTSLYFNSVGTGMAVGGQINNQWMFIPQHRPHEDWIEGPVLYKGMDDFIHHSYVQNNAAAIYNTDKSGGILYVQGTVFMRPCLLWPWYIPWILDTYGSEAYTIKLVPTFSTTPYLNATEATLFYETVSLLKEKGVITDKHIANLKDNNKNMADKVRVFHFQALFIPHRFVAEFMTLLEGFKDTPLSSYVYIPYIYQLLWDKNSWYHLGSNVSNTIYASTHPLLTSCLGDTVEYTMENINTETAQELSYFAYGWCGWPSPISEISYVIKDEIKYITKTAKVYFMYHVYEFVFWTVVAMMILCGLWCVRRRIYDCYLRAKSKIKGGINYSKLEVPKAYVAEKNTYAMNAMKDDGGYDDEDEDKTRNI